MRFFSETQRFNQWWLKLIMLSALMVIGGSLFLSYPTIEPEETDMFIIATTGTMIIMITITMLLFSIKLRTKIDEQGIHYQFQPIQRSDRIIPWNDIEKCYVRKYNPISEYGGWGYKVSFIRKTGAFNIRGNIGIQILFKNGKKLLIGTQKEKEAKQVLAYYTDTARSFA